jgi:hypothetical protein
MAEVSWVADLDPGIKAKINQLFADNVAADAHHSDDPTELTPGEEQADNQIPSEDLPGPDAVAEVISNAPVQFPAPFSFTGIYSDPSGIYPQQLTADRSGSLNISITTYSSSRCTAYAAVGSAGQYRNVFSASGERFPLKPLPMPILHINMGV